MSLWNHSIAAPVSSDEWHTPVMQIIAHTDEDWVSAEVNRVLGDRDLRIIGVSPAAVVALRESDSLNNPLLQPHYAVTVLYQARKLAGEGPF